MVSVLLGTGKFQVNVGNASAETAAWDNTTSSFDGDISSGKFTRTWFWCHHKLTRIYNFIGNPRVDVAWSGYIGPQMITTGNTGGTQRMTLDSSGKVGIGTTSPDLELTCTVDFKLLLRLVEPIILSIYTLGLS